MVSFRYGVGWMLLLAFLVLPARVSAQGSPVPRPPAAEPEAPEWFQRITRWSAAVFAHEPGRLDTAAVELSAWTADDITTVVDDFLAVRTALRRVQDRNAALRKQGWLRSGAPVEYKKTRLSADQLLTAAVFREEEPGDGNRVLRRAAMLHADVGLLASYDLSRQTGKRETITVQDGVIVGYDGVSAHWGAGRRLLDAVEPAPADDGFVRLWYHAVAAALLREQDLSAAKPHLEHALSVLPRDANIHFESGYYHQAHTGPSVRAVIRMRERTASRMNRSRVLVETESEITESHHKQAERRFRQAIEIDPGHVEARMRLGTVLLERNKVSEAAGHLRDAAEHDTGPVLAYLAHLLRGQAEERLGRLEEAAAAYGKAAALVPEARSPQLALAALDRGRGAREKAWAIAKPAVEPPTLEQINADPWWAFHRWQSKSADVLLAELRAIVRAEESK